MKALFVVCLTTVACASNLGGGGGRGGGGWQQGGGGGGLGWEQSSSSGGWQQVSKNGGGWQEAAGALEGGWQEERSTRGWEQPGRGVGSGLQQGAGPRPKSKKTFIIRTVSSGTADVHFRGTSTGSQHGGRRNNRGKSFNAAGQHGGLASAGWSSGAGSNLGNTAGLGGNTKKSHVFIVRTKQLSHSDSLPASGFGGSGHHGATGGVDTTFVRNSHQVRNLGESGHSQRSVGGFSDLNALVGGSGHNGGSAHLGGNDEQVSVIRATFRDNDLHEGNSLGNGHQGGVNTNGHSFRGSGHREQGYGGHQGGSQGGRGHSEVVQQVRGHHEVVEQVRGHHDVVQQGRGHHRNENAHGGQTSPEVHSFRGAPAKVVIVNAVEETPTPGHNGDFGGKQSSGDLGWQQNDRSAGGWQQNGSGWQQGATGGQGWQQGASENSGWQQGAAGNSGWQQAAAGNSGWQQGPAGNSGWQQGAAGNSGWQQDNAVSSGAHQGATGNSGWQQGNAGGSGW